MLTALGGIACVLLGIPFLWYLILVQGVGWLSLRVLFVVWVASSYSHLILVSLCETLLPYYKLWVSPVGASAFVATGYPPLFLSYSFFLGAGGRAYVFCSAYTTSVLSYAILFVFVLSSSIRLFFA